MVDRSTLESWLVRFGFLSPKLVEFLADVRSVLAFYVDAANYERGNMGGYGEGPSKVMEDGGSKARVFLTKYFYYMED